MLMFGQKQYHVFQIGLWSLWWMLHWKNCLPTQTCIGGHLCKEADQLLFHVLNNCFTALDLRHYNTRDNYILKVIFFFVKNHIPTTSKCIVDLCDNIYRLPAQLLSCSDHPNIILWDDCLELLFLIELTIPYKINFDKSAKRNSNKEIDLLKQVCLNDYHSELMTLQT